MYLIGLIKKFSGRFSLYIVDDRYKSPPIITGIFLEIKSKL